MTEIIGNLDFIVQQHAFPFPPYFEHLTKGQKVERKLNDTQLIFNNFVKTPHSWYNKEKGGEIALIVKLIAF